MGDLFKICPKCGEAKPATTEYFHKRGDTKSGLAAHCKICRRRGGPPRRVEIQCPSCGKTNEIFRSRLRAHNFCNHSCQGKWQGEHRHGENNPSWKGGRVYDGKGYVKTYSPDHPNKSNDRYVYEHRLVMEKMIGRYLLSREIVHHKNGVKDDNRPENLQLFGSTSEHRRVELQTMSPIKMIPKWARYGCLN